MTPEGPWDEARATHVVEAAIRGGVNLVQLRARRSDLDHDGLLAAAKTLRELTWGSALLFVSADADTAVGAGADGLQMPEAMDSVRRTDLPSGLLIGRSVHSATAAVRAHQAGADLLIAGSVYPTRSHPGQAAAGLGLVRDVVSRFEGPVLGIGGIDESRAAEVMGAGAGGVAVISAIWDSPAPEASARVLMGCISKDAEP